MTRSCGYGWRMQTARAASRVADFVARTLIFLTLLRCGSVLVCDRNRRYMINWIAGHNVDQKHK